MRFITGIITFMVDFFKRNKAFIIGVLVTCVLIVGGVSLFSDKSGVSTSKGVETSVLVSDNSYKTSGFVGGQYLPASMSASLTLVEFGDYVCPACAAYEPYVKKILTDYAGKITFVFRNYPLSYHTNAPAASYAVEAAGIQGKYWEMHEKVFTTKDSWANLGDPTQTFVGYATKLDLNIEQFKSDMTSQKVRDIVTKDKKDGDTVGLSETPTFYLNGEKVTLTANFSDLESLIGSKLGN